MSTQQPLPPSKSNDSHLAIFLSNLPKEDLQDQVLAFFQKIQKIKQTISTLKAEDMQNLYNEFNDLKRAVRLRADDKFRRRKGLFNLTKWNDRKNHARSDLLDEFNTVLEYTARSVWRHDSNWKKVHPEDSYQPKVSKAVTPPPPPSKSPTQSAQDKPKRAAVNRTYDNAVLTRAIVKKNTAVQSQQATLAAQKEKDLLLKKINELIDINKDQIASSKHVFAPIDNTSSKLNKDLIKTHHERLMQRKIELNAFKDEIQALQSSDADERRKLGDFKSKFNNQFAQQREALLAIIKQLEIKNSEYSNNKETRTSGFLIFANRKMKKADAKSREKFIKELKQEIEKLNFSNPKDIAKLDDCRKALEISVKSDLVKNNADSGLKGLVGYNSGRIYDMLTSAEKSLKELPEIKFTATPPSVDPERPHRI